MKIWKYILPEHIFLDAPLPDKASVFHFVAKTLAHCGAIGDAAMLCAGMQMREETMSTGIGRGIGIPHTVSQEAKDPVVILIRAAKPIDYESLDKLPVDIVMALVVPVNQTDLHLRMLAGISRLCNQPDFLKTVRKATQPDVLWHEIKRFEEEMAFH